jgi:hypothetical protein
VTPDLQAAVSEAYRVFATRPPGRDLDFAARVSASQAEHELLRQLLATTPPRELPPEAVDAYFEYIDAAFYDGGFRQDEVRYFLPRALELLAQRKARPWLRDYLERIVERGRATESWPPEQTAAIARIFDLIPE